jgi:hypothetical protein
LIEEGGDTFAGRDTGVYTVAWVHTIRRKPFAVNPAAVRSTLNPLDEQPSGRT